MARTAPSPVAGRPLTALYGDDDPDGREMLTDHVATEPWRRVELLLRGAKPSTADLAELAAIMTVPPALSAFLVQAATDIKTGEAATKAYCGYALTGQRPDDLYADILSGERARPVLRRLRRAQSLAHKAMKVEMSSGPYTAGAWLCWAMGATRTAQRYATRALDLNSGHRLAADILVMARMNASPSWPRPR